MGGESGHSHQADWAGNRLRSDTMADAIKKNASGFTLAEVMIVVALIAIVTAIAIPAWQSMKRNSDLKSAAYEIMATIQWAKSEAARRNTCIGIDFTAVCPAGQANCYQLFSDATCNRLVDGGDQILRAGGLGIKAQINTTFTVPNNVIAISPRGLLRTGGLANGNVSLSAVAGTDNCYNLTVSPSVGLRLNPGRWNAAAAPPACQ
jgi:type IV fimbrial biogenesis protein FimT